MHAQARVRARRGAALLLAACSSDDGGGTTGSTGATATTGATAGEGGDEEAMDLTGEPISGAVEPGTYDFMCSIIRR
jgi:hypothetical protein